MKLKSAAMPLPKPDHATHTLSVKVPRDMHRAIVAYAGRRAAESGARATESDVVRAILTAWLATAEATR